MCPPLRINAQLSLVVPLVRPHFFERPTMTKLLLGEIISLRLSCIIPKRNRPLLDSIPAQPESATIVILRNPEFDPFENVLRNFMAAERLDTSTGYTWDINSRDTALRLDTLPGYTWKAYIDCEFVIYSLGYE
jgi:hypothetical protein